MNILPLPAKLALKQNWAQLHGASLSLALAELCALYPGIKLIIAPDNLSATGLAAELEFFNIKSAVDSDQCPPEILLFPDWEILPYDRFSPHPDIISQRLYVLSRIQHAQNLVIISAASTLMQRLCPLEFITQYAFNLKCGQILDLSAFKQKLEQAGYNCVSNVLEHGEFACRGSILDIYPMGSIHPIRIELFDELIESLRSFDPETQLSLSKYQSLMVLPAREFLLNDTGIALFRRQFRTNFSTNPSLCALYESISDGCAPSGVESYLPLFFNETATFFNYLPQNATLCLVEDIANHAETFWHELNLRYEQFRHDIVRPILAPNAVFLNPSELLTAANCYQQVRLFCGVKKLKKDQINFNTKALPDLAIIRKSDQPLDALCNFLIDKTRRYLLVVQSAGRREFLLDLLKKYGVHPKLQNSWVDFLKDNVMVNIIIAPLNAGVELLDSKLVIIVEAEIFGEVAFTVRPHAKKFIDVDLIIRDLVELRIGAPIVHLQFGIGRYQGLSYIEHNNCINEFLVLSYAGDDKIYVPVSSLNLINRYSGADAEHAPLHKLGADRWQKEKKQAVEKIHDIAIELLDIYAKRAQKPGYSYKLEQKDYQDFVDDFPFTETFDQMHAIAAIIKDMQSSRPMDRLICGDVGFGKTEVAMRAAFIAVFNAKQVCVLVPTTLLAAQHFESFSNRFAQLPIKIELLSRFRNTKDVTAAEQGLKDGRVDIVIGTHKLFQKHIQFHDLGLLIIDEEHRFGVKQKEHIKSIRADIDILSMTATPIPRTLNMAMAGIRDISLIATPPAKRLAIKTFWQEKNNALLREAILREILRGGQVFFLHNNVQTIATIRDELQLLVPEARVHSAHGQMHERELERVMSDFYHHRFNVLVCTTIIETGIDIPTANTIIIDRADKFGLAQLHQLRGRVGRSHHQAYAYLLTPDEKLLTPDAVKRLEALVSLDALGAGFSLATHDMEIRGAGALLGEDQSGNMQAVGFSLFMELLDRAVSDLKSGKIPELEAPLYQGPEIDLQLSAIIPDDYIADIHMRLVMYKRIASVKDKLQLQELQIELIDRFGMLPLPLKYLIAITELKLRAANLGIKRIFAAKEQGLIEFEAKPNINESVLISLIQVHAARYKLDGALRLRFKLDTFLPEARIIEITNLLLKLSPS